MLRKLLLSLALIIAAAPSWAAVTFDAKGTAACDVTAATINCTTLTIGSITNGVLVVPFTYASGSAPTGITATWNGTSMTLVGQSTWDAAQVAGTGIFCLAAPASGSHTLTLTMTGGTTPELHVIGASYAGANQTTPCKNFTFAQAQVGNPATITVTSATGDIALATFTQSHVSSVSMNGTTIVIDDNGPNNSMMANYNTGAATVTLTATASGSTTWDISGVDIAAAAGGGSAKAAMVIDEDGAFAP